MKPNTKESWEGAKTASHDQSAVLKGNGSVEATLSDKVGCQTGMCHSADTYKPAELVLSVKNHLAASAIQNALLETELALTEGKSVSAKYPESDMFAKSNGNRLKKQEGAKIVTISQTVNGYLGNGCKQTNRPIALVDRNGKKIIFEKAKKHKIARSQSSSIKGVNQNKPNCSAHTCEEDPISGSVDLRKAKCGLEMNAHSETVELSDTFDLGVTR